MAFDLDAARTLLDTVFAPWLQDLQIRVDSIDKSGAVLRLPFSERLCRDNGVICGQAIMSLADTAMVFAVSAAADAYLPMTTVDQSMHFLRPASRTDLLARASVVRLGRTMAFGSISIDGAGDGRPVAMAQTAYAILREGK